MKVSHKNIVTASVVSEATEAVGVGSSSLADCSFTIQRQAKWWSHTYDNDVTPDYTDKLKRAPLTRCIPHRLRGGNGDISDDVETGTENTTPIANQRKRKLAGNSPPGLVPDNIATECKSMERYVLECKAFMQDMLIATKAEKKWILGIEEFLEKIQSCGTAIALEAAVISGKYQEAKLEATCVNRRLEECLSNQSEYKRLYAMATKNGSSSASVAVDDFTATEVPPAPNGNTAKERLG